ncbi:MAG: hypothetical protein ACXVAU_17295 [Mucilaginibacter sp.]
MRTNITLIYLLLTVCLVGSCNFSHHQGHKLSRVVLPNGFRGNTEPGKYKIYWDSAAGMTGNGVGAIRSIQSSDNDFATILNFFLARNYLNKRVRYTAYVKSKDVTGWAGLWMRVDPENPGQNGGLAFDNMQERPIKGTNDWTKYSIVLDVPNAASEVYYGVLLSNNGKIWVDSTSIQVVGDSVPVTDMVKRH